MGTWRQLNTQTSGLPADWVTDIVESPDGALWFSTYGGGLARLDPNGRDWKNWRAGSSPLASDYVGTLALDGAGRLWAVCDARKEGEADHPGGVCALSPETPPFKTGSLSATQQDTWQVYPRGAHESCIVCLEADRVGTLWLRLGGIVFGGYSVTYCDGCRTGESRSAACEWQSYDGKAWTAYENERAALAAWWPQRPARTRLGWELAGSTLWMLERVDQPMRSFQGLGALFGGAAPLGLPSFAMIPGMGSFASDYNLVTYDGQEFRTVTSIPSPYRFGELVLDTRGHAWVSLIMLGDMVISGGVGRWDGAEWTLYKKDSGLQWDTVMSLSADSRGNVWCAHMLGDVSRWDGSAWSFLPGGESGRPKEDLGRAIEDRQGRLWFPSKAGAVVCTF